MRSAIPISLALLSFTSLARADAVDPEPETCPPGSAPSTAHSGPYCAPTAECGDDSDCATGACMQAMQCVETRGCGGRILPNDAEPCTLEHVVGPCAGDGSCAVGQCRARRVCSSTPVAGGGCGCRAAGRASAGAVPLALLALALLGRPRRPPRRVSSRPAASSRHTSSRRAPCQRGTDRPRVRV